MWGREVGQRGVSAGTNGESAQETFTAEKLTVVQIDRCWQAALGDKSEPALEAGLGRERRAGQRRGLIGERVGHGSSGLAERGNYRESNQRSKRQVNNDRTGPRRP